MTKEKLTKKGHELMHQMYGFDDIKEAKKDWVSVGISMDLLIASFNYGGEVDEANPDQDFIAGIMWERKRQKEIRKRSK